MKNWHKITIALIIIVILIAIGLVLVDPLRKKEPEKVVKLDEIYAQLKAQETTFDKSIKNGNLVITKDGIYNLEAYDIIKRYNDPTIDTSSMHIRALPAPIKFELNIITIDNDNILEQVGLKWIQKDKLQVTTNETTKVYNLDEWTFYTKTQEENNKKYVKNYIVHKKETQEALLFSYVEDLPKFKSLYPYPTMIMEVTETNNNNIKAKVLVGSSSNTEYLIKLQGKTYPVGTKLKVCYKTVRTDLDLQELTPVKLEKIYDGKIEINFEPNNTNQANKILKEPVKYPYSVYSYGGNVNIKLDGTSYLLEEALLTDKITMEEILYNISQNNEPIIYQDGGSREYKLDSFNLIKLNMLNGNSDVYFTRSDVNISALDLH